jgi:probable HAF family extracellular repeat protein
MWTVDAGMRDLAPNIVIQGAFAAGVSGDGTVVAGRNFFATSSSDQATRWTSTTGTVGLGGLTDALRSQATAVSLDGETIIGGSTAASGFNEAFRWTETSGMIGLGLLPGGSESLATGVSRKGAVIVGGADSLFGKEAFYWTEKDGMAGLGDLAGGTFSSFANGVSANGKRVVGYSDSGRGQEAFLWTKQDGMISLASFLGGMGANLDGWQLTSATAISADGSTIVGYGINPQGRTEAWVVKTLPEPSAFALMLATLLGVALAGRVRKVRVACGP